MIISRDLVITSLDFVIISRDLVIISWELVILCLGSKPPQTLNYEISWNNQEISWNNHEISWLFYLCSGHNVLSCVWTLLKIIFSVQQKYREHAWPSTYKIPYNMLASVIGTVGIYIHYILYSLVLMMIVVVQPFVSQKVLPKLSLLKKMSFV